MLFVSTDLARKPQSHWKDSLCFFERSRQKQYSISTCQTEKEIPLAQSLCSSTQRRHRTSENLKWHLEVKPQERLSVNNIKNTNKQAKNKTDWSQQIYVHIHIKKRAVSGVGEGVGEWGRKRRKIWAIR